MTKEILSRSIDAFISRNKEAIIQDIGTLVAIESVRSEPAEGAPYGVGPRAALDAICAMAERMKRYTMVPASGWSLSEACLTAS